MGRVRIDCQDGEDAHITNGAITRSQLAHVKILSF